MQGDRNSNWQAGGGLHSHPHQSPAPLSTAPCNIHLQPVSQWASQAVKAAGFTPKVLLVLLLSICSTTAPPCLGAYWQIHVCQTLQWLSKSDLRGASLPTLPLTQRANAPLKMHILPAHLVYLMHMHHTSGTKRNDIASDTEYPSSDIQFRFLQEEAGGFFPPRATVQTEPWESVKQIQDLLKGTHLDAG